MKKFLKILAKIILVVLILAILLGFALALLFTFTDPSRYKNYLSEQLKERTGVTLQMSGPLDFKIFPIPRVQMEQVYLEVPMKQGQVLEMKAEQFDVALSILSYFKRDIQIRKIYLQDATLKLREKGKELKTLHVKESKVKLNFKDKRVKLPNFDITLDIGKIKGTLTFDWSTIPLKIYGDIYSNAINLKPWSDKEQRIPTKRVIPKIEIPFQELADTVLNVRFNVKSIELDKEKVENLKLTAKTKDKSILFFPLSFKTYDGIVDGDITLTPLHGKRGALQANLQGKRLSLENLLNDNKKKNFMDGGQFTFTLNGKGQGQNLQDIFARWDGSFQWVLGESTLYNEPIQTNLSEMLFGLVGFLNPRAHQENHTQIKCAAMKFDIKNGIALALNRVGIETKQFDVMGSGQVNLKNEHIDFEFNLRKKRGIQLSFTEFDKYVRLSGTLSNPTLKINPKGVITGGATLFSALTTGGLSLVAEQVFGLLGEKGEPCATVLEK